MDVHCKVSASRKQSKIFSLMHRGPTACSHLSSSVCGLCAVVHGATVSLLPQNLVHIHRSRCMMLAYLHNHCIWLVATNVLHLAVPFLLLMPLLLEVQVPEFLGEM
jgi:hypothetical protein